MKKIIAAFVLVGTFTFATAQSNYYNDYQNSISGVDWQSVVTGLLLNTQQSNQLTNLNQRYPDQNSWNRQYRNNPNAWRTDRNREIQRILGPTKYKKFKNKSYKRQNPTAVYNRNKKKYQGKDKDHHGHHDHDKKHRHGKDYHKDEH